MAEDCFVVGDVSTTTKQMFYQLGQDHQGYTIDEYQQYELVIENQSWNKDINIMYLTFCWQLAMMTSSVTYWTLFFMALFVSNWKICQTNVQLIKSLIFALLLLLKLAEIGRPTASLCQLAPAPAVGLLTSLTTLTIWRDNNSLIQSYRG